MSATLTTAELEEVAGLLDRIEAIPATSASAEEIARRKAELIRIKGRAAELAERIGYSG